MTGDSLAMPSDPISGSSTVAFRSALASVAIDTERGGKVIDMYSKVVERYSRRRNLNWSESVSLNLGTSYWGWLHMANSSKRHVVGTWRGKRVQCQLYHQSSMPKASWTRPKEPKMNEIGCHYRRGKVYETV